MWQLLEIIFGGKKSICISFLKQFGPVTHYEGIWHTIPFSRSWALLVASPRWFCRQFQRETCVYIQRRALIMYELVAKQRHNRGRKEFHDAVDIATIGYSSLDVMHYLKKWRRNTWIEFWRFRMRCELRRLPDRQSGFHLSAALFLSC